MDDVRGATRMMGACTVTSTAERNCAPGQRLVSPRKDLARAQSVTWPIVSGCHILAKRFHCGLWCLNSADNQVAPASKLTSTLSMRISHAQPKAGLSKKRRCCRRGLAKR